MQNHAHIQSIGDLKKFADEGVIESLFKTHYPSLCRTIFKIVKDTSLSEDIVQEVFLKMWSKRDELEVNISVKAYLFRAAINSALNSINQSKKISPLEEENLGFYHHSDVEDNIDLQQTEIDVKSAIDCLPPACRTIFILSRYEEMSYKEIADSLQISVKTVENQMGKALKVLRELLKHHLMHLLMTIFLKWFIETPLYLS